MLCYIGMKFITRIMDNLFRSKNLPPHLGRWKIENCNEKMNKKIDLSNEDHCGPCGQYSSNQIRLLQKIKVVDVPKKK